MFWYHTWILWDWNSRQTHFQKFGRSSWHFWGSTTLLSELYSFKVLKPNSLETIRVGPRGSRFASKLRGWITWFFSLPKGETKQENQRISWILTLTFLNICSFKAVQRMVQNMETRFFDANICKTKTLWDLNHCYVPASCVIILNPGVSPSLIKLHISTTLRHFGPTPLEPAPFRRIRRSKCCRGGLLRKDLQMFLILLMAEILHQLIGTLSHWIQCFIHPRWCRISSINSVIGVHSLCYIILLSLPKRMCDLVT